MNPGHAAAARFSSKRFLHGYARGKTAWDPAYPAMADRLRGSSRPILDIGCGVGLLAAYLRESGCMQRILGIEPDAAKVALAKKHVEPFYPGVVFHTGTAENLPESFGDVVMLDVLHYMESDVQRGVLDAIAVRLLPGDRVFVRTTFRDGSLRYGATMIEEAVVRLSGWIRGGRCIFPTREEVCRPFQERGYHVTVRPMWGWTPFNSHLVEVSSKPIDQPANSSQRA